MSNIILHGKKIITESYYDGNIASTKQEYETNTFSSRETMLRDVIDALSVISSGETTRLTIEVCVDSKGRYRLIRKWVI